MWCRKSQKYIYLYRPGELTDREQKKLQNHLASCSNCRLLVESIPALQTRIGNWKEATAKIQMRTVVERRDPGLRRVLNPALSPGKFPLRFAAALFVGILFLFCLDRTVDAFRVARMESAAANFAQASLMNAGFRSGQWISSSIPMNIPSDWINIESQRTQWTGSTTISGFWTLLTKRVAESRKNISWWNGLNEGEIDLLIKLGSEIIRFARGQ